jgi:predicted PurR-regulated permease PerM
MIVVLVLFFLVVTISVSFVKGIDNMQENYPNHKDEDSSDEEDK